MDFSFPSFGENFSDDAARLRSSFVFGSAAVRGLATVHRPARPKEPEGRAGRTRLSDDHRRPLVTRTRSGSRVRLTRIPPRQKKGLGWGEHKERRGQHMLITPVVHVKSASSPVIGSFPVSWDDFPP